MRFSILMAIYNKKYCLKKYFDRIINQTNQNYEIIIVDDCSVDGSYEYLSMLKNKKIRLYRNEKNMGLGYTRNILLNYVTGDYVLFLDPDDYIELDLLERLDEILKKEALDIIRFQNIVEHLDDNNNILIKDDSNLFCCESTDIISGEEALLLWCMGENNINTLPWTYCIKKELYNNVQYPATRVLEDFAVTPYLIASAKTAKAIDYVGYHYIKQTNSLSNPTVDDRKKYAQYKIKVFKKIVDLCIKNINQTSISNYSKNVFIKDVKKRYKIRLERVKKILEGDS